MLSPLPPLTSIHTTLSYRKYEFQPKVAYELSDKTQLGPNLLLVPQGLLVSKAARKEPPYADNFPTSTSAARGG